MHWAAVIEYIPDPARVQEVRPQHRAYLTSLLAAGQLVCAGPFLDDFGALIVYHAADQAQAESFIRNDPFHQAGIFVRWTLRPWKPVLANSQHFPGNP